MALRTVGARAWTGLLRGVGHALPANKPGPALGLAFFSRPSSAAPPQAAAVLAARIGVSAPCACGTRRHLSSEAAASADASSFSILWLASRSSSMLCASPEARSSPRATACSSSWMRVCEES